MKTKIISKLAGAIIILSGLLCSVAHAIVPDPGNIYYGLAKDFMGLPLTPEANAEVVMVRTETVSGTTTEVVLSRSPILNIGTSGGTVNYVLRPPLDDGLAARYDAGSGRKNDSVAIYVIHNGIRYETHSKANCTSVSDPVPNLGERGSVREVDFRCIDDWDGDCMADSWEISFFGSTEFNGTDDWDADGLNDLAEFSLGTNPLESNTHTNIALIVPNLTITIPQAGVAQIDWDIQEGVNYTLEWSGTLENFVPVPVEKMVGTTGHKVNIAGMSKRFFRVLVSQ